MALMRPMRFASVWLIGFTLASCGSRTIGESAPQASDPTTGSGGGGAGMSSGGMTVGGTGGVGGSGVTGGVGGSGATGGNGATGGSDATGGSSGSGTTSGSGGSGVTGGVGGSGANGGSGGSGGAGGAGGTTPIACPCTRRPGPGSSSDYCGLGSDITGLGKITVDGGQRGLGFFTIDVPPGALLFDTTFIVHETKIPPPVDYVDFSPIIVVAPFIATLSPVKLTIGNVTNAPGVPRTNVSLYAAKDQYSPYTRVADSKFENGEVRASVSELGAFFVGYPKSADQANCP